MHHVPRHIRDWNARAGSSHVAQTLLDAMLRFFPADEMKAVRVPVPPCLRGGSAGGRVIRFPRDLLDLEWPCAVRGAGEPCNLRFHPRRNASTRCCRFLVLRFPPAFGRHCVLHVGCLLEGNPSMIRFAREHRGCLVGVVHVPCGLVRCGHTMA